MSDAKLTAETLTATAAACTKHVQDRLNAATQQQTTAQSDALQYAGALEGIKFLAEELGRVLSASSAAPAQADSTSPIPDSANAPAGN